MAKTMKTFDDLFVHFLKDIYFAERQIYKSLPKMVKAASSPELKHAFTEHRAETQHQIERLQHVFEALGKRPQAVTCEAILGILEECDELIEEAKEAGPMRDAGLIACGQAVEHYEMTRYGSLIAWAKVEGHEDVVALLQETLDEEKTADSLLSKLAEEINQQAYSQAA